MENRRENREMSKSQSVRDPVCGMSVNPDASMHHTEYEGQAFHFCCAGCKTKFDADPIRYLANKPKGSSDPVHESARSGVKPEAREHEMGVHGGCCHTPSPEAQTDKDPVCGMTVDPRTAKHRSKHDGRTFYFCSAGCKAKFDT